MSPDGINPGIIGVGLLALFYLAFVILPELGYLAGLLRTTPLDSH